MTIILEDFLSLDVSILKTPDIVTVVLIVKTRRGEHVVKTLTFPFLGEGD